MNCLCSCLGVSSLCRFSGLLVTVGGLQEGGAAGRQGYGATLLPIDSRNSMESPLRYMPKLLLNAAPACSHPITTPVTTG
jgi:hypothetical protein